VHAPSPELTHDLYLHIRVIISIVLGIAITRVLSGLARFVQHPGKLKVYPVHLLWALIVLIASIHFWWWEFGLTAIASWRFELFLFVLFYAFLFALMANILFPDELEEYEGYQDYFQSRRGWFFGLLIVSMLTDWFDTAIKGHNYLASFGFEYPARIVVTIALALVAMRTRNARFHLFFALLYLVYYVSWIIRVYDPGRG
jgi:Na+/serine symporter